MIEIDKLVKHYQSGEKIVRATDGIPFQFEESGLYFILGKSGCGKTTLLNLLAGLDSYDSGKIIVNGCDISKFNETELDDYRNLHIGIVFQEFNLLSDVNVFDNLRIVLELQNDRKDIKHNEKIEIKEILKNVGLEGYENRKISQLSGGERQRIAIARSLLKKPDIIFADEPTGNLDKKSGENVLELLKQISKKKLVIVVSHDKEAAYKYGDKVVSMSDGKIIDVEDGEQDNLSYSFEISRNGSVVNDFQNLDIHKAMEVVEKIFKNTSNQDELLLRNITKAKANSINHEELTDKNIEKSKSEVYKLSVNYKLKLAFLFIR